MGTTTAARPVTTAASLTPIAVGCGAVEDADPQILGVTYAFDAPPDGEPGPITIRFAGHRTGVRGEAGPGDTFRVHETVQRVTPGSGHITVSKRIGGITPGAWTVAAAPVVGPTDTGPVPAPASTAADTGWAPLVRVRAPGVRIGAWPALVGLGAVVALAMQALLAARLALPVSTVVMLSLLACLVGLVGGKLYYLAESRGRTRTGNITTGMCIQGFVLAAVGTVVAGALLRGIPVGALLDATAPGLLLGMAIGRIGCFLGGCCAGRPTASRWGLWSSDRRLGARRIPTQLLESAVAFTIGSASVVALIIAGPPPSGIVFVAALAGYTLGRQLLFPLREQPRKTAHGRTVVITVCVLALATAAALTLI